MIEYLPWSQFMVSPFRTSRWDMGPPCFVWSPSGVLSSKLTQNLSFGLITYRYNSLSHRCLYSFALLCLESTMVTTISLTRRRGDGLSPGCPLDFILHSTGRLCVKNKLTLWERGSFSQSQGFFLFEPGSTIDIFTILFSLTSCQLTWRNEDYFRFLAVILLFRGLKFLSDLLSPCQIT